jgi:hypothetical protein
MSQSTIPVRERVSSFSQSSTCLSGSKYHVESLHSMPALEGVSSFSWSTIYLSGKEYHFLVSPQYNQSGSAYRPLVSSLYAYPETWIVLESVHCLSVWEGIVSLSHSTIRPWSQSSIYLSGSAYHPSVNSLYVCPRGRIILESVHYMSVRELVTSLSHSTVRLSRRAYHP